MHDNFFSYELTKEISSTDSGNSDPALFYKRSRINQPIKRSVSENDVRDILNLLASSGATVFPSRYWNSYARYTSLIRYNRKREKNFARFAKSMRALFSIESEGELEALFRSHLEMMQRRRMMLTIDSLARRKNPEIKFKGAELLHKALGRGQGAIIWAFQFTCQTLAGKRALWEQGFRPVQISSENHGFSETAFGNIAINSLLRRAEDRYLKQRITFDRDHGAAVTRKIIGLLDQGALLLMTNNTYAGNMFVEMRFGKHGYVSMPTAPLSIVARRNTPLFSMATLETAPLSQIETVIEPIDTANGAHETDKAGKRNYQLMARLARSARDNYFKHCSRAPDQLMYPEAFADSTFEPR